MSAADILKSLRASKNNAKPGDRVAFSILPGEHVNIDRVLRGAIDAGSIPEGSTVEIEGNLVVFSIKQDSIAYG